MGTQLQTPFFPLHFHHHNHHHLRPAPPWKPFFSHPPPSFPISSSSQLHNRHQTPSPPTTTTIIGPRIDKSLLQVSEAQSDTELWAAASLRVRSFYNFPEQSFGVQDHKRYLAESEHEALKERVAGKRLGFIRVSCINASLTLSQLASISNDLCSFCKVLASFYSRIGIFEDSEYQHR